MGALALVLIDQDTLNQIATEMPVYFCTKLPILIWLDEANPKA